MVIRPFRMVVNGIEFLPPSGPDRDECDEIEAMYSLLGFMRGDHWTYEKKVADNVLVIDRFEPGDPILGRITFSGSQEEIAMLINVLTLIDRAKIMARNRRVQPL